MKINQKYLIHTDNWFFAPDGNNYHAVHGTVHAIVDAEHTLGIRTNAKSTNWYVVIGDMVIAGCQIHYAIRSDTCVTEPQEIELQHEGELKYTTPRVGRIYNADASGLIPVVP